MIKKFLAPDGAEIVGTLQTVQAIAKIEGIESTTGEAIYTGDSIINWESMKSVLKKQSVFFVDVHGRMWQFPQLRSADGLPTTYDRQRASRSSSKVSGRPVDADLEPSVASPAEALSS